MLVGTTRTGDPLGNAVLLERALAQWSTKVSSSKSRWSPFTEAEPWNHLPSLRPFRCRTCPLQ